MPEHHALTRVVVLGGGYAGTMAANHLRQHPDLDVTLVNPRPVFVERIRLHQLVAGNHEATVDFGSLLGGGVRLVVDSAARIDMANRQVEMTTLPTIDYDYLIYAIGSTAAVSAAVPGAREFAYPVAELEHAQRLRSVLDALSPGAPITVVGAGLTGIETATELAERGHDVTLVGGGQLGGYLLQSARRSVAKVMRGLAVDVLEDELVTEVRPQSVVLSDGRERASSVTVWVAGFGVPELARRSGLRTDDVGRLLTDETLTSVDDERIVAAGDSASPSGQPLRMSCQMAIPLGARAAQTVLGRIAGNGPSGVDQASFGACISLGRKSGVVQFAHLDDRTVNLSLSGRAIAPVKEAVCRSTVWTLRREARRPGSYCWPKGGSRQRLSPSGPAPGVDARLDTGGAVSLEAG
jgi:NADH dehydrogenase